MKHNIQQVLAHAQGALEAAGVPSASQDAARILAHVLGRDTAYLRLNGQEDLSQAQHDQFVSLLQRRCAREPVSHLTGSRAFWTSEFIVTADVLDPRPETEMLVDYAIKHAPQTVLDLGTGSGAIAISIALELRQSQVSAVDISPKALSVAEQNKHRLGARNVTFVQSDWFSNVQGTFDLIVSNPPYIPQSDIETLDPEVRLYEPLSALTPGGDGLDAYRIIFSKAAQFLNANGHIAVEFGIGQGDDIAAIAQANGYRDITLHRDLSGRDRVLSAQYAN